LVRELICNCPGGVARPSDITGSDPERAMSLFSTMRVPVDVLGRSRRGGLSRRAFLNGRLLPARLARQVAPEAPAFGDDKAHVAAIVSQRQRISATARAPRWW
jgi:hypothetical protein